MGASNTSDPKLMVHVLNRKSPHFGRVGQIDPPATRIADLSTDYPLEVTFIDVSPNCDGPVRRETSSQETVMVQDVKFLNKGADETRAAFAISATLLYALGFLVTLSAPVAATVGILLTAILPLFDAVTDVYVVVQLHLEGSPHWPVALGILVFSSLSAALFAAWEASYGSMGIFSSNQTLNVLIAFFLGLCNVRIQVLAVMLAYAILYKGKDAAKLRICYADPIDSGTSFVTLSLMMLVSVITETTLELLLQGYIVVEDYFVDGGMPETVLILSMVAALLTFASTCIAVFMHNNTAGMQMLVAVAIIPMVMARIASLAFCLYLLGPAVGFAVIGASYAVSVGYNCVYHFDFADAYEFGPGGMHEKIFHLFIDSQLVFLCPFAYAGKVHGNRLYDDGSVSDEYPGYIHSLPISFIKDNSVAEGNFVSVRAWRFGLWRFFETIGIGVAVVLASDKEPWVEVVYYVGVPQVIALVVHSILTFRRHSIEISALMRYIKTKEDNPGGDNAGCLLLGCVPCCGYRRSPVRDPGSTDQRGHEDDESGNYKWSHPAVDATYILRSTTV